MRQRASEKDRVVNKILQFYQDNETDADIDEMRSELMWRTERELKRVLVNTRCLFPNKRREYRVLYNKSISQLQDELNLVEVV